MANACDYNCVDLPDHEQVSCNAFIKGGIGAGAFVACDHTITDWSNTSEWEANIASGKVKLVFPIRGSIPEPAAVEGENPNGCGALNIVDTFDRSLEIKDYNVTANNIDMYNQLNRQKTFFVAFQGCDSADRIWVVDSPITWNARHTIDENNRIKQMFTITGTWTEYDMPTYYDAPTGIFS